MIADCIRAAWRGFRFAIWIWLVFAVLLCGLEFVTRGGLELALLIELADLFLQGTLLCVVLAILGCLYSRNAQPQSAETSDEVNQQQGARADPPAEPPAPYRQRLARFLNVDPATLDVPRPAPRSRMTFWMAVDALLYRAPKSAALIRYFLERIQRGVRENRRPDADCPSAAGEQAELISRR